MSRGSGRTNMRSWKSLSPFDNALEHALLLVVLAWLILVSGQYRITVYLLALLFFELTAGEEHLFPAALILILFLVPSPYHSEEFHEGKVIKVRSSYCIVEQGFSRLLLYTRAMPVLDSTIRFDGAVQNMTSAPGFYRFDFAEYCRRDGITLTCNPDHIEIMKNSRSIRGRLMERIVGHVREEDQPVLLDLLFQIRAKDQFDGLFRERGFSLSGVISFAGWILSYVLFPEDVKKAKSALLILLCFVFHFPYLPSQRLIFLLLEKAGVQGRKKTALGYLLGLRLFPSSAMSASFLIPALFAFSKTDEHRRLSSFCVGCHLESLLFHAVNPLELLCFRFFLPLTGFLWLLGLLEVFLPLPAGELIRTMDRLFAFFERFRLPGTLLGFGLLFYLPLAFSFRSHPRALWINTGLFLFFQLFGLFHPLAELTFINVGQGDAILIRSPFRTGDILVDTGKPSQWNALNSFLEAKGISSPDTLVITHADKDHSGNLDAVKQQYKPRQVITEHQKEILSGIYVLHDLNEIRNDDENESSVVLYFLMNGKRILLMGDSTVHTEETIVHSDINLSADLLKLSHHGSHTGSCDLFLDTVQPGLAIVSSGAYEIYHHPSPETVEKLNARRIPYLDTKEEGDISVFFLPAGISFLLTSRLNFQLTGL